MAMKQLAAAAALSALCAPALAFDQFRDVGPSTVFYISVPIDSHLPAKQREIAYGIRLQGKHEYQGVNLDSRMFHFLPLGGLEVRWVIAGAMAVGAVAAMGGKSASTTAALQEQQTQHAQHIQQQAAAASPPAQEPCPKVC